MNEIYTNPLERKSKKTTNKSETQQQPSIQLLLQILSHPTRQKKSITSIVQ